MRKAGKNVVTDCGTHASVTLTQGKSMLLDWSDVPLLAQTCAVAYRPARTGDYWQVAARIRGRCRPFTHLMFDVPEGMSVDHINRDTMDNRRANLRITGRTIQAINRGKFKNNKTGLTGVIFDKANNRWRAFWAVDGRQITRSFRCVIFGYERAKELAIEARRLAESRGKYVEALGANLGL